MRGPVDRERREVGTERSHRLHGLGPSERLARSNVRDRIDGTEHHIDATSHRLAGHSAELGTR